MMIASALARYGVDVNEDGRLSEYERNHLGHEALARGFFEVDEHNNKFITEKKNFRFEFDNVCIFALKIKHFQQNFQHFQHNVFVFMSQDQSNEVRTF